MDLLESFLDYYKTCSVIEQIEVVWSESAQPPLDWLSRFPKGKVVFEVHLNNSLSNRFRPLQTIPTEVF